MRNVNDELAKVKSNNLELVMQSNSEVEAMRKVMEVSRRFEEEVGRLLRENEELKEKNKGNGKSEVSEGSVRVEDPFVTDGLASH